MNRDHIEGKIIAITRGIHLRIPPAHERMDVFTIGSHQLSWWLTHQAIAETREVAEMIRELDPEFAHASNAAIRLEIDHVLRTVFWIGPYLIFARSAQEVLRCSMPPLETLKSLLTKFATRS